MDKVKIGTCWLDGCSGCHMSLLDIDEAIVAVLRKADIVYGPLVDAQEWPEGVDVAIVEGAVSNQDDVKLVQTARARSRYLIALGDCAVTGNVTAMRNPLGDPAAILRRVYVERVDRDPQVPGGAVPALLPQVLPLHQVIDVDVFMPGCPPPAERIKEALVGLLAGTLTRATTRSTKATLARGASIRFG